MTCAPPLPSGPAGGRRPDDPGGTASGCPVAAAPASAPSALESAAPALSGSVGGATWAAIDAGGTALLSFATLLVVARLLGPGEFGLATLALATVQFINIFVEGLFHDALVQRETLEEAHLDSAFWTALVVGTTASLAALPVGDWLAEMFGHERLSPLIAAAALSLPCSAVVGIGSARLRRALRFRALAWRSLASRAIGCGLAILVAVTEGGAWSVVAQQLGVAICLSLLLLTDWRPRRRFDGRRLGELASFALPQLLRQALWVGRQQGFLLLAGSFAGVAALGQLNVAFRTINTLQTLFGTALQQFTLPHFARRQSDRGAMIRAYQHASHAIAVVAFPVFAGLALVAADLVPVVLGGQWQAAVPAAEILALGAVVNFAGFAAGIVVTAFGRLSYALVNAAAALIATIGGMLWLQPQGAALAALLWTAPLALSFAFSLVWLRRLLSLSLADQIRPVLIPLLATACMALGLEAAEPAFFAGARRGICLAEEIVVGAVIYATVLLLLDSRVQAALAMLRPRPPLGAATPAVSPAQPQPRQGERYR